MQEAKLFYLCARFKFDKHKLKEYWHEKNYNLRYLSGIGSANV